MAEGWRPHTLLLVIPYSLSLENSTHLVVVGPFQGGKEKQQTKPAYMLDKLTVR